MAKKPEKVAFVSRASKSERVKKYNEKIKRLTSPRGMKFAAVYAATQDKLVAYKEAFGDEHDFDSLPITTIKSRAANYLLLPKINDEVMRCIEEIRKNEVEELTLGRAEKRRYLARIVRTNLLAIDPDNPDEVNGDLVDSVTRHYDKEGNHVRTVVKLPGKLQAIEIDNKMTGHNEPDVVEHRLTGGVMVVPTGATGGDTLTEWEKAAQVHQEELKSGKDPGAFAVEGDFTNSDEDEDKTTDNLLE